MHSIVPCMFPSSFTLCFPKINVSLKQTAHSVNYQMHADLGMFLWRNSSLHFNCPTLKG